LDLWRFFININILKGGNKMRKQIVLGIFALVLGLGLILGEAPLIYAQESDIDEFTLEEITVTAQKREQELQKVATSVEVIQGYELTEMGHLDLDEALRNVSSAIVQSVGEEMTVIIRGMDNDEMPGDGFSQVAVTVDGSYQKSWGVGTTGLYDMKRIEVLAGPQGTMYSRNSSGGVVNMISYDPDTEAIQASGSVEMGNFNLVNTQGVLNVPLKDKWAFRAAFINTKRDGYASTGVHDADDRSMRLKLAYYPSDTLSAVLTYEYTSIGGKSQGDGFKTFEDQDDVDNPWTGASPGDLFGGYTQTDRFYMNLNLDTPFGTVTFIPSYIDTDRLIHQAGWVTDDPAFGMGGRGNRLFQDREFFNSPQEEQSYELRMASREDSFMKWLIGIYYFKFDWHDRIYHKDVYYVDPDNPANDFFIASTEFTTGFNLRGNKSKAAFGNLTYPLTDRFRITAGGRYTKEDEYSARAPGGMGPPPGPPGGGGAPQDPSHFDYKLGAEYDLSEDSMVWVDYSTGYKQVRGSSPDQELKSYQIGSKSRFLDNRVQFNATAFYYDYTNFNIRGGIDEEYRVIDGETVTFRGSGTGDAILYGADASIDYVITNKDRLNLSLSSLSADVDKVLIIYSYQGIEYPDLVPPKTIGSGKPLNNAPELSVVGSYEHRFDLANGGAITPTISARYTSKYILEFTVDERNIPEGMDPDKVNTEPSHIMGDFSLNYSHHSGKWTLNGYVKNVTNYAEKNGIMRGDLRIGSPRTYGMVLSVRF
jgi:iron complex outermembrane receptor protein